MDILRQAYNQFADYERPLPWNDPRRVPLDERGVRGTGVSCIGFLGNRLDMSDTPVHQLFSGFRGSGKSTELNVLAKDLADRGYEVIYIDSVAYLNLEGPTSISQVLIALAAGFDRHLGTLRAEGAAQRVARRFWERFHSFLGTELSFDKATVGVPDIASLEVSLKQDATFREKLEQAVAGRLPSLARECLGFMDEALAEIRAAKPSSRGTVVIFDSFEKLRGGEAVWASVENVFVRDREFLRIPCHAIYTVPPWMGFLDFAPATEFGRVEMLPMCRVFDRANNRKHRKGMKVMFELLGQRADLPRLFAEPAKTLEPLVSASGGYPRELLRMMCDLLVLIRAKNLSVPVPAKTLTPLVRTVIQEHVRMFDTAICDEDLDLLARIGRVRALAGFRRDEVHRLARLFDHHFILCYRNGEPWFDLHPLVRMSPKLTSALADDGQTDITPGG